MPVSKNRIHGYKYVIERFYQKYLQKSPPASEFWSMHPQGEYFIDCGGSMIPPPLSCNIVLTNICNLKCTICGNQNFPDIQRRSMKREVFRAIADTLFPVLTAVELNSEGEPLVYPHIEEVFETIKKFNCALILQTNATRLNTRIIDLLCEQMGELSFSVDATGEIFNSIRKGTEWDIVDRNIRLFMKKRNPEKMLVQLTPVITENTLPDMQNVLTWAYDLGVDKVVFRRYEPIGGSPEVRPDDKSISTQIKQIKSWLLNHPDAPFVSVDVKWMSRYSVPVIVTPPGKRSMVYPNYPQSRIGGHPSYICPSPNQYVDIDMDGNISACCRTQSIKLGSAVTIQDFASSWFGTTYQDIRTSLRRGSSTPNPLEKCKSCIQNAF